MRKLTPYFTSEIANSIPQSFDMSEFAIARLFPTSSYRFRLVSHSFVKNGPDLVNNMAVLEIIFAPLFC